jgi:hypothetical protein
LIKWAVGHNSNVCSSHSAIHLCEIADAGEAPARADAAIAAMAASIVNLSNFILTLLSRRLPAELSCCERVSHI